MSKPSLLTSLMFWYDMEENYALDHTVYDSSGRGNHIPTSGRFYDELLSVDLGERSASSAIGLKGDGIQTALVYHRDHEGSTGAVTYDDFRLAEEGGEFTFAGWIFADIRDRNNTVYIGEKGSGVATAEYSIFLDGSAGAVEFTADTDRVNSDDHGTPTQLINFGEWNFVVGWVTRDSDGDPEFIKMQLNNGLILQNTVAVNWDFTTGSFHLGGNLGSSPEGTSYSSLDMVMGWKRILTQDERTWLYNNGAGRNYSEVPDPTPDPCKTVQCSPPDTFSYVAEDATESDAGTNAGSQSLDSGTQVGNVAAADCSEPTEIISEPPAGSKAIFPLYVKLSSNFEDAVIRYTTDGTDPTEVSLEYSAPLTVDDAGTTVKAKAFLSGCPDSDIAVLNWLSYNTDADTVQFDCDSAAASVDKAGQVIDADPFVANGVNDFHWFLDMTQASNLGITRMELYHLDSSLDWVSGRMWSTDKVVTPPPPWDQDTTFESFPLVLFDGAVQQNSDYLTTYGTVAAGTTTYDLYGDPGETALIPVATDYYKLIIYLQSGQRITAMRSAGDCIAAAEIGCPAPTLTTTPKCGGEVQLDFEILAPARNYLVNRFYVDSDTGTIVSGVISSGTDSGAVSYTATGLNPLINYSFFVQQQMVDVTYSHCPTWISSPTVQSSPLKDQEVTITADETVIAPSGTFNLTTTTKYLNADATLSVAPAIAGFPKTLTKNLADATVTAVTLPAADDTDYLFTISGPGTCGSPATAQVTVRAEDIAASCADADTLNTSYSVSGYSDSLFVLDACTTFDPDSTGSLPPWDGVVSTQITTICAWANVVPPSFITTIQGKLVYVTLFFSAGEWRFDIQGSVGGASTSMYYARKTFGKDPTGLYTRVSGCITNATITIT